LGLKLALGVNGVDGSEGMSEIGEVDEATHSRLVITEEDEGWKDDGEKLSDRQGAAS